jgi:hypothetical protein
MFGTRNRDAYGLVNPYTLQPDNDDGGDGGRPRWLTVGWIIAALVVVGSLVVGGMNLLLHDDPAAAVPGTSAAPADGVCPEWNGTPGAPPASGADHEWALVGKVAAPGAPTIGPARTTGAGGQPLRSCWAPGEGGALFAAANWLAGLTSSDLIEPTIRDRTAPGSGRDALIQALESTPLKENADAAGGYKFIGYRFQTTDPARVTVSLAFQVPGKVVSSIPVTCVWDGERRDWLVDPPPEGNLSVVDLPTTRPGTTPLGYVGWTP